MELQGRLVERCRRNCPAACRPRVAEEGERIRESGVHAAIMRDGGDRCSGLWPCFYAARPADAGGQFF
jgi:hypothetical protein